jgi:hypothetical protein
MDKRKLGSQDRLRARAGVHRDVGHLAEDFVEPEPETEEELFFEFGEEEIRTLPQEVIESE